MESQFYMSRSTSCLCKCCSFLFFSSAISYWLKALGIYAVGFWIRADFLYEIRWQEGHLICKIQINQGHKHP